MLSLREILFSDHQLRTPLSRRKEIKCGKGGVSSGKSFFVVSGANGGTMRDDEAALPVGLVLLLLLVVLVVWYAVWGG